MAMPRRPHSPVAGGRSICGDLVYHQTVESTHSVAARKDLSDWKAYRVHASMSEKTGIVTSVEPTPGNGPNNGLLRPLVVPAAPVALIARRSAGA